MNVCKIHGDFGEIFPSISAQLPSIAPIAPDCPASPVGEGLGFSSFYLAWLPLIVGYSYLFCLSECRTYSKGYFNLKVSAQRCFQRRLCQVFRFSVLESSVSPRCPVALLQHFQSEDVHGASTQVPCFVFLRMVLLVSPQKASRFFQIIRRKHIWSAIPRFVWLHVDRGTADFLPPV